MASGQRLHEASVRLRETVAGASLGAPGLINPDKEQLAVAREALRSTLRAAVGDGVRALEARVARLEDRLADVASAVAALDKAGRVATPSNAEDLARRLQSTRERVRRRRSLLGLMVLALVAALIGWVWGDSVVDWWIQDDQLDSLHARIVEGSEAVVEVMTRFFSGPSD